MQNLLAALGTDDIRQRPFPHIDQAGILPADLYAELSDTFPAPELIMAGRATVPENAALRLSSKTVLRHPSISPIWKDFFELHVSPVHWHQIIGLFGDVIRATHPGLEDRFNKPLADFSVGLRGDGGKADIRLECQFVINTPTSGNSSVKTPHVDKRQTVFAGLFYMRDPWDRAGGGELELYHWRRPPRFLPYRMILPDDVERIATIPYSENRLACFINSPLTVHGVSPRGPANEVRRYINLVAEVGHHLFRTKLVSLPAGISNWREIRAIRRQKIAA